MIFLIILSLAYFNKFFRLQLPWLDMVLIIIDGIYAISAGAITALIWIIVLAKKQGSKFIANKHERIFHITAEFVMASFAISTGIALLLGKTWGISYFYLTAGFILYASINAIGLYFEKNKLLVAILILTLATTAVLTLLTLIII